MPGMWQTFDAEQDDDLTRALARQELQNRQGLGIAKAFEDQQAGRERTALSRDTLEMNREYREEMADTRRQRNDAEIADKESRVRERELNEKERVAALTEADRIIADPNADEPSKQAARAIKLRLKPSISVDMKPATKGVHFMGRTGDMRKVMDVGRDDEVRMEPAPTRIQATMPGTSLNPSQYRLAVSDLSKQYVRDTAAEQKTMSVYRNAKTAWDTYKVKAGARDPGAQTILVNFQKTLDPESVVRESEYARSVEGQPMMDRLRGVWNQFALGGPRITDEGMQAYLDVMKQWASEAQRWHAAKRERIERNAEDYGIPADRIIPQTPAFDLGEETPPDAPPTPAAAPGASRFNPRRKQ